MSFLIFFCFLKKFRANFGKKNHDLRGPEGSFFHGYAYQK